MEAYSHCCRKMLWSLLPRHHKMTVRVIKRALSKWLPKKTSDQQKLQQRHQRHIWRQFDWKDLLQHIQQPSSALPCHALPAQPFQLSQLCGNISIGMGQGHDDLRTGKLRMIPSIHVNNSGGFFVSTVNYGTRIGSLWLVFCSQKKTSSLKGAQWLTQSFSISPPINIKIWQLSPILFRNLFHEATCQSMISKHTSHSWQLMTSMDGQQNSG